MQQVAWLLSLALMLLVAMGFGFVALKSGRRADDYTPLQVRAYRIRTKLFWALVLVLGPAMVYTLLDLPYAAGHAHACLLYTSPSPRDRTRSRMPSSA